MIEDPLAGRARRRTGGWTAAELGAADRIWTLQEDLRAAAIPGSRGLVANQVRLDRILKLLRAGVTEDDCSAVLRAQAERVERDPGQAKWFNGETTWRPENFDRQLGQLGADPDGDRRGPATGYDHVLSATRAMREAAGGE